MFKIFMYATLFGALYSSADNTTPEKKQIRLIQEWKKMPRGMQNFIVDTDHDELAGEFSWDLEKNVWAFRYAHVTWEVKDEKLFKIEEDSTKSYPCVGFSALLKHPIDRWPDVLEKQEEVCNGKVCFLFARYNKKTMIWQYQIEPFALLSIGLQDSSERYYQMSFAVPEELVQN